jgi:hypothetical protein
MTSAGRPLKVFLCHAHADRDSVRALYTRLTKDGVNASLFVPHSFLGNKS